MGLPSARKASQLTLIYSLLFILLATINVSCFRYEVGGDRGWIKPDGSEYESYNEWAQHHRVRIGDSLYFKYTNDSVLVVSEEHYAHCVFNNPISKFENGNTDYEFDHSGFYYFISGLPGHCQAGQKIIIWVMSTHHSNISSPASSPETERPTENQGRDSDYSLAPSQTQTTNSTETLPITSIVLNLFMGVVLVLYMFMEE